MLDSRTSSTLLREVRPLVAHLNKKKEWIYWTDFLSCLFIGYGCAGYYLQTPWPSWTAAVALLVGAIFLYRLSLFMHEIVHFRRNEMCLFQIMWNVLVGIPMLIPSFFYETHRAHHSSNSYGTANDGEYLPLSSSGWWGTIKFLSEIFVLPFYFVLRFSIGTPLSMFSPRLREYLLHHHSSLVIDLKYEREIPDDAPRTLWACIELACFVRIALILVLISVGVSPWTRIVKLFAISFLVLGTNHLRTLSAHRYRNQGHQMTHDDQFADSTNIEGNMFTELFCPLGLRYHALHHLLPRLPYHNLRAAHRLLSQQLPADSRYHQATYRSCSDVMREFFANLNEPETRQTAGTSSTEN